jgi:glucose/arabinose dehydrogenase
MHRLILACGVAAAASTCPGQVAITLQSIPGGWSITNAATAIGQPPGETRYVYATIRGGVVRVIRDGVALPTPALTISGVSELASGLAGMAFHPAFPSNHYVYFFYGANSAPQVRIVRYTISANPEVIDPTTAYPILSYAASQNLHQLGGWIAFGPDGYLYMANGSVGSLPANDLTAFGGKLLRIDVDGDDFADPQQNYAVPPTNPYFGSTTARPEIWAFGLRIPRRGGFDRLTGDLWFADSSVFSSGTPNEIDFQPAALVPPFTARDYGFPCWIGTSGGAGSGCNTAATMPRFEYSFTPVQGVIGGSIYRGAAIPALRGRYIFADRGNLLFSFYPTPQAITEGRTHAGPPYSNALISGLGEDNSGELYLGTENFGIYKIVPACYANCDGSTAPPVLNVLDFNCFLNAFSGGDPYANCDGSTTPPVLNVLDFNCFLNRFTEGCP